MELTGDDSESVAHQFLEHRFPLAKDLEPDQVYFGEIVSGVPHRQAEIDRIVQRVLSTDWPLKRMDATLRAIFRAAVYELIAQQKVPAKVIIDEYVGIAHAFFQKDEPAFLNASLDRIARRKRAAEFGETSLDDDPGM